MRLFLSINLSPDIKKALIDAQKEMCAAGVQGNFSPNENLHLTVAFVGEFPDPMAVLDALSDVQIRPFTITLEGCGAFGDLWWAGIKDSAPLESVVRRVRRCLADAGIPFDRKKFLPHITLVRRAENGTTADIKPASMPVDHISLMRSDRGKRGMIYTEIGTI